MLPALLSVKLAEPLAKITLSLSINYGKRDIVKLKLVYFLLELKARCGKNVAALEGWISC